mmetsp:Transcript_23915/g.94883  ORF Transcript_23915/g.94883 Transcript_23915/m.94883 type:complete len:222 (-) Transcript_23915:150-815(-)
MEGHGEAQRGHGVADLAYDEHRERDEHRARQRERDASQPVVLARRRRAARPEIAVRADDGAREEGRLRYEEGPRRAAQDGHGRRAAHGLAEQRPREHRNHERIREEQRRVLADANVVERRVEAHEGEGPDEAAQHDEAAHVASTEEPLVECEQAARAIAVRSQQESQRDDAREHRPVRHELERRDAPLDDLGDQRLHGVDERHDDHDRLAGRVSVEEPRQR